MKQGVNSEFDLINKNEATDVNLKGNQRMLERQAFVIPSHGQIATAYRLFFFIHKVIILFYVPINAAFSLKPDIRNVFFDFYLDFIFLIEIITMFFLPYTDSQQRYIIQHSKIAFRYLTSWFILDILALIPLSKIRYDSEGLERSKDDWANLTSLNFKSLPRFYPLMLLTKFVRVRKLSEYLEFLLQKSTRNVTIHKLTITFTYLFMLCHTSACGWRMLSLFDIYAQDSWLRADDSIDKSMSD